MEEYKLAANQPNIHSLNDDAPEISEDENLFRRDLVLKYSNRVIQSAVSEEDLERDERFKRRKSSNVNEEVDPCKEKSHSNRKETADFEEDEATEVDIAAELKITVLKKENYKYIGETFRGLRNGFGVCYYTRGDIYIGQWKKDKKEGLGKTILNTGEVNIGELKNNYYCGYCESFDPLRQITVTGYALGGKFTEEVIIQKGSKSIEGVNMENIISNPVCKLIFSGSHYFIGEVDFTSPNLDNRFGISLIKGHSLYIGEINESKYNGYAELYNKDGSRFYGFFDNGIMQGLGITVSNEGTVSMGNYKDDMKQGPFYIISKGAIRMDLYYYNFRTKVVEKIDKIKAYIRLNYPEFYYLLNFDYKMFLDKFGQLNEHTELLKEVIMPTSQQAETTVSPSESK